MPDIQALTGEVQRLQSATDWWTNVALSLTALTAIVGVCYFVASRVAINRGAELRTAQASLGAAKEQQLSSDLRDKDIKIAAANQAAAEAIRAAEAEKLARVRIEETLSGWRLDPKAQERLVAKLKPYAKTPFDLAANPVEARFVETLDRILLAAGWIRHLPRTDNQDVTILLDGKASIAFTSGLAVAFAQERKHDFGQAAAALVKALNAEGIPVREHDLKKEGNPAVIHISVGKRE